MPPPTVPLNLNITWLYVANSISEGNANASGPLFTEPSGQQTNKPTTPLNFVDLEEEIYQMGGGRYYRINWDKVNKVINQNTGIPEKVSY